MSLVEIAALRAAEPAATRLARALELELPGQGRVSPGAQALLVSVRPARWLALQPPDGADAALARWERACAGLAAVIDLSAALRAFYLEGPAARELLARGCRLDLDPGAFPPGHAAATIMVQVAVVLAALPCGWLLLTPATTARHMHEWLIAGARPFGLAPAADVTVSALWGDRFT